MVGARAGRVLQLLGPSTGGIRRHVATLSDDLAGDGWEVTVAGPVGVMDGLRPLDVQVPVPSSLSPLALVRAARRLRAATPTGAGSRVVHAHGLKAGWVAAAARRRPLVLTVHNVVLADGRRWTRVQQRLERFVVGRADEVIATSDEIAVRFKGVAPRITTIAPVHEVADAARTRAEVRAALGLDESTPLVVAVGRLHHQKGFDVLLEALAQVRSTRAVHAAIVGGGPEDAWLAATSQQLGLDGSVTFIGHSDRPVDELAAADLVVIPSRWESGPLVLLEAMSHGRPVVATPVGFVPDLVRDGETGWVVPVEAPGPLAAAIVTALADPAAAEEIGRAGQAAVRPRLDHAAAATAVEAVYRRVLT
jgi:glycosyltransferase involved in cell wall biosynthesis